MRRLWDEMSFFLRQKVFVVCLALTAAISYGFAITHESIGVDDTMVGTYLNDGLGVIMGRWTIYLINKVFYIGEFAPFITELVGVLLLLFAILLFCVLLKRIFGDRIGILGYTVFSCVFVSCPFISEVYVYYYHNGVDVGYVLLALSLLLFEEGFDKKGKKCLLNLLISLLLLWTAVGCYESFLIMYVIGVIVMLFFEGIMDRKKLTFRLLGRIFLQGVCISVSCILLRVLMQRVLSGIFSLSLPESGLRDFSYGMSFFQNEDRFTNFFMLVKRYWLVYFVNGILYFPIRVHVLSVGVFAAASVMLAVKRRTLWYILLFAGMVQVPFLLTLVEAVPPMYRACLYMPFFVASAMLLLYLLFVKLPWKRVGLAAFSAFALILVWNQAFESNRNFYTDYRKCKYEKEILTEIAREVTGKYGPGAMVIFTGKFDLPDSLTDYYYADYSSEEYARISKLTDWLDPHLKEKYHSPHGYSFAGEARYSLIDWGMYAYDRPGLELIHFLQMHGYELQTTWDKEIRKKAESISEGLPKWPMEGSVTEMDGYVIVHF